MDETTLINAARRGDLNAFNELILLYQDFLFGVALRMLGYEDSAADAMQETLISAFRKLNTFRGESLKHWLARIVVNACYDELRRKHRQRVCRDREFLEIVMVDDGVNVEAGPVRMFDLVHDFPDHAMMRLAGRRLDLRINSESHRFLVLNEKGERGSPLPPSLEG